MRQRLLQHVEKLRKAVPEARASWSHEGNTHLTLKFLGDISRSVVNQISAAASRAVLSIRRFPVSVEQTGVFPSRGTPRVLWIGINDATKILGELHSRLENECATVGFSRDERPFHPHITLARLRKPQAARSLAVTHKHLQFEQATMTIEELLVIRSELGGERSKYTVISRHPLLDS